MVLNMLKNRKWDRHKKGGLNFTELGFGSAPLGNLYRSILSSSFKLSRTNRFEKRYENKWE